MNCVNHPETPVSAYCQNCGKALCQECIRSVGGVVYCEACLAARLNQPGYGAQPGFGPASQSATPGSVYVGLPASGFPNPGLALGLGFIPGVGAMYNGQFVKGLAHVIIFALLVSAADHEGPLGILVAFWIAYQVFDSYQTARARRDGTPLPNPFGLNDLGFRLGLQQHPEVHGVPPAAPYAASAPGVPPAGGPAAPYNPAGQPPPAAWTSYVPPEQQSYAAGFAPGYVNPGPGYPGPAYTDPGYTPGYTPGVPPYPAPVPPPVLGRSDIPTGAVVLIALGVLFLLGSLGIFHDDWISRGWPLAIVGVGVWLVIRRMRETRLAQFTPPPPAADERNPR